MGHDGRPGQWAGGWVGGRQCRRRSPQAARWTVSRSLPNIDRVKRPAPPPEDPSRAGIALSDRPALPDLAAASPALRELAARGVPRRFRRGQMVIEEGDAGDTLFIVLAGRLRVYAAHAESGREITFGSYGPGEYVGELSLDGNPRSASVEATEATRCAVVTRPTLQAFIAERPEFAFELLAKVIARARAATLTARQLALNDVYGRLRLLLLSESAPQADGTRTLREPLTHLQMAQRIGCSREMVSRLMKDLERGGFVTASRGSTGLQVVKALPGRW